MNVQQIFHPYWLWEDHKAGMYNNVEAAWTEKEIEELANKAKTLLSDSERFKATALKVLKEWPISAAVNLSNIHRNRQAWVGQASCCFAFGAPEFITKYGWMLMPPKKQAEANLIADKIIQKWETKQKGGSYAKKIFEY